MFIVVKFPSRGRPEKLISTLKSYIENANNTAGMFFVITLDSDDPSVSYELISNIKAIHENIRVDVGLSGSKIKAINRDLSTLPPFDILLLASDDMIPVVKGYDDVIRNAMQRFYPSTDGVLWFDDGFLKNRLNTLCILGRKYFERFGYIYHPDYTSLWSDNEFTEVANILKRQTYIDRVIIRHEHPDNGMGRPDELYFKNHTYDADKQVFFRRRRERFGVPTLPFLRIKKFTLL
jgi:hypothetical protein